MRSCLALILVVLFILIDLSPTNAGHDDSAPRLPDGALARLETKGTQPASPIWSVAFSPDGKTLAAGTDGSAICLWDVATGKERRLRGHLDGVQAVAFAPDGKTLLSGSRDRSARIWDIASGKELRKRPEHRGNVFTVALSPDGKLAASGGEGGATLLWNTATGDLRATLEGHKNVVYAAAFSPDHRTLATGGHSNGVILWDPAKGRERRTLVGNLKWVTSLAYSPDGKIVAAAGRPGKVHLWETATGQLIRLIEGRDDMVTSVAFSPDTRLLAWAGGFDHTVHLCDLLTGEEVRAFKGHTDMISSLAFAPNGKALASGSRDTTVLLWELPSGNLERLPPMDRSRDSLDKLWSDLTVEDAATAFLAIWALAVVPDKSVAFLKEHLPVQPAESEKRMRQLIADLDSEQFEVRNTATQELEKLVEQAEPLLLQALEDKPSLEARRRIERLLEPLEQRRVRLSASDLRHLRAVQVLEQAGTPEARQVLEGLAKGAPGAWLTQDAIAALTRLRQWQGRK